MKNKKVEIDFILKKFFEHLDLFSEYYYALLKKNENIKDRADKISREDFFIIQNAQLDLFVLSGKIISLYDILLINEVEPTLTEDLEYIFGYIKEMSKLKTQVNKGELILSNDEILLKAKEIIRQIETNDKENTE